MDNIIRWTIDENPNDQSKVGQADTVGFLV